jgi:16S rRNA (cytidine1402-2'-O)-methyltransferase
MYEDVVRGKISELRAHFEKHEPRGEFVIVIAGTEYKENSKLQIPNSN